MEKRINIGAVKGRPFFDEKKMARILTKNSEDPQYFYEFLLAYSHNNSALPYYAEKWEDLPTDYLVELFIFCSEFIYFLHDWTIFSPKQIGKLIAHLGSRVIGKCAAVPVFNTADWVQILIRTAKSKDYTDEQKNEICQQCPWLYFTPKNYAEIYAVSDALNERIIEAVEHFSHDDWYEFFMFCANARDFVLLCPDYYHILDEFPDLKNYL